MAARGSRRNPKNMRGRSRSRTLLPYHPTARGLIPVRRILFDHRGSIISAGHNAHTRDSYTTTTFRFERSWDHAHYHFLNTQGALPFSASLHSAPSGGASTLLYTVSEVCIHSGFSWKSEVVFCIYLGHACISSPTNTRFPFLVTFIVSGPVFFSEPRTWVSPCILGSSSFLGSLASFLSISFPHLCDLHLDGCKCRRTGRCR